MLHICQKYEFIIIIMAWLLLKKPKDKIPNAQNRRSGGKANHIYETFKNTMIPHGYNICAKSYDMSKAKTCEYSQLDHALPHWKCVFQYCAQFQSIIIPDLETNHKHLNPSASFRFQIYHIIAHCKKHGRILLTESKLCRKCQQDTNSGQ